MTASPRPMVGESAIQLALTCRGGRLDAVTLSSTRRADACRVLEGRSVDEALKLVPLLFSICGRAQTTAARMAVEAARGIEPDAHARSARVWLNLAEAAQESLWRLAIDLPGVCGEAAVSRGPVRLRREFSGAMRQLCGTPLGLTADTPLGLPDDAARTRLAACLSETLEADLLGEGLEAWRAPTAERLTEWLARGGTAVARAVARLDGVAGGETTPFLPPPGGWIAGVAQQMDRERAFAAAPMWRGACRETGALARLQGMPLAAVLEGAIGSRRQQRALARIVELVAMVAWLRDGPPDGVVARWLGGGALAAGNGFGWAETARGLLIHAVALAGDTVARYHILAPTEWNFHPRGVLAAELLSIRFDDETALACEARLSLLALDPCVGYEVKTTHA